MKAMKYFAMILCLTLGTAHAQQLGYRMPRDAGNNPIPMGIGLPYAFTLTPTTASYDNSIRYALPATGRDLNRAYRHILVRNPSTTRTVYVCFGTSTGCSTDHIIVPSEYAFALDSILYGDSVGFSHVYAKLDAVGSVAVEFTAW